MIFEKKHDVTKEIMCEINRIFINAKKLALKKKKSCYESRKNRTFYYKSNKIKQISTIEQISTIKRIFTIEQIFMIERAFTIEQAFTIKQTPTIKRSMKVFEQYI